MNSILTRCKGGTPPIAPSSSKNSLNGQPLLYAVTNQPIAGPTDRDFTYGWTNKHGTIEDLLETVSRGHAIWPCHASSNHRKRANWLKANVIFADIDSGITLETAQNLFRYSALGIYTTRNHQKEKSGKAACDRFRVIFRLPFEICEIKVLEFLYKAMTTAWGHDLGASNAAQAFLGNADTEIIRFHASNVLQVHDLIAMAYASMSRRQWANLQRKAGSAFERLLTLTAQWRGDSTLFTRYVNNIDVSGKERTASSGAVTPTGDTKRDYHKFRDFDFDFMVRHCKLYQELESTTNDQMFGLATNLANIEGGRRRFLADVVKRPFSEHRTPDYYNRVISSCTKFDYAPKPCEAFCPYHATDKCHSSPKNLLRLLPDKRGTVKRIKPRPAWFPLKDVRKELESIFNKIVAKNDGLVHLILAPPGAGKTHLNEKFCSETGEPILIVYPTHRLLESISIGTPVPKLPYELDYVIREGRAFGDASRRILENLVEQSWSDKRLIELYEKHKEEVTSVLKERVIKATHERLIYNPNLAEGRRIIIDEDVMPSVLKESVVSIKHVERFARAAQSDAQLKDMPPVAQWILDDASTMPVEPRENYLGLARPALERLLDNEIAERRMRLHTWMQLPLDLRGDENVLGLFGSDYYVKQQDTFQFISRRDLDLPNGAIILSATAEEEKYRAIFGDRLRVHRVGPVRPMGELIQYHDFSFSRTSITSKDDRRRRELTRIAERALHQGDNLISYKMLQERLQLSGHFGALEGLRHLEGQNLTVIGTPNMSDASLKLVAAALDLPSQNIRSYELQHRQQATYGSFVFDAIPLSENTAVRNLQFQHVEAQLLQAVGRARYYEHPCRVTLYSNFPLEEFDQRQMKQRGRR